MKRALGFLLSTSVCALLLSVATARAADGRIAFSGSIVVPTCQLATDTIASATVSVGPRQSCGGSNSVNASTQIYTVSSRPLTHVEPDRVLNYFEDYVIASQADAAPALITQSYE